MRSRPLNTLLIVSVAFVAMAGIIRLRTPSPEPSVSQLSAGDKVRGSMTEFGSIGSTTPPSLVIFYTPECPWCRASIPWWNQLRNDFLDKYPGSAAFAVTLRDSVESTEYVQEVGLMYDLYFSGDMDAMKEQWKARAVPYTVVVGSKGEVVGAWVGVVDSVRHAEILATLP